MKNAPLAVSLRPNKLDDILGQNHLLGPGKPFRKMVETRKCFSTILWGSPGTGKTTIVRALALETDSEFYQLNATSASVKDLRKIIDVAKKSQKMVFVFIDEIHRFSKSQQDVLLPHVEDGVILFFGATTEKPQFAVNSTILSRCLTFETKPLDTAAMVSLIKKVKNHYKDKGKSIKIEKDAARKIIIRCGGDARKIITVLETIVEILSDDGNIAMEHVNVAIPEKHLVYNMAGNDKWDHAHCYQEAIQNSDVDGAIYWLAKWITSGEDPAYICRRMLITAFEDCAGNPFAASTAMAAAFATERTGLPECMIPMSLATCEMAMSRRNKSAYNAIKEAMDDVQNNNTVHVPPELRAGSSGYVRAVDKTYLKGWTRDWEAIERNTSIDEENVTVYAIGIEHSPGEFGMIAGPHPDLKTMTREFGGSNQCVLQITKNEHDDPKYDILYRWDVLEAEWVKQ